MSASPATWLDELGIARLEGFLVGDFGGLPTGWSEDASNPANVTSNGGALDLTGATLTADTVTAGAVNGQSVSTLALATFPLTSGALPDTGAWVSGTAKQNPTHGGIIRDVTVCVVVVTDGTANAATCTVALSPDDVTYTTIGIPGASAAVNTVGAVTTLVPVHLPADWFIKLTLSHVTVAASVYY